MMVIQTLNGQSYTSFEDALSDIEHYYKRRPIKLQDKHIKFIAERMMAKNYGTVAVHVDRPMIVTPASARSSVCLTVMWYKHLKTMYINSFLITNNNQLMMLYGRIPEYTETYDKAFVWGAMFADRYNNFKMIYLTRYCKQHGFKVPDGLMVNSILDVCGPVMLVSCCRKPYSFAGLYLISQGGAIFVQDLPVFCTIRQAAKRIGLRLPRNLANRIWEDIQPYWIIKALAEA